MIIQYIKETYESYRYRNISRKFCCKEFERWEHIKVDIDSKTVSVTHNIDMLSSRELSIIKYCPFCGSEIIFKENKEI